MADDPTAEVPITIDLMAKAPMAVDPTADALTANDPIAKVSTANNPMPNTPMANGPMADTSKAYDTMADASTANNPMLPMANGTMANTSKANDTVSDASMANDPMVAASMANDQMADAPTAVDPKAHASNADNQKADAPIADESTVGMPSADRPMCNAPISDRSLPDEPSGKLMTGSPMVEKSMANGIDQDTLGKRRAPSGVLLSDIPTKQMRQQDLVKQEAADDVEDLMKELRQKIKEKGSEWIRDRCQLNKKKETYPSSKRGSSDMEESQSEPASKERVPSVILSADSDATEAPKSVWICGDSFVYCAARRARASPLGEHFSLAKAGIHLHWLGNRGMIWDELVLSLLHRWICAPPAALVIHLGANDLLSTRRMTLVQKMEMDLAHIAELFPSARIGWSNIIPRVFSKDYRVFAPQNFSDYEAIKDLYKPEVPEYFNFASDVLDKWSEMEKDGKRPLNPALWWIDGEGNEVKWSFEELGMHSKKVANILSDACGLQRGDRIFLILPRIPEWWLFNVASMRTGLVLIPGTTQLTAKDILHRLRLSKARCIVTNEVLAPMVDSVLSDCDFLKARLMVSESSREGWLNYKDLFCAASADHRCVKTRSEEPMTIFFTSGTTGSPKMTEHSQRSYGIGHIITGRYWMDLTPSDIMWNTSDTGWAKSAWSNVFSPWIQGSCVFSHKMPRFEATSILETLSKFPITTFCCNPTSFRMLVLQDISSYKFKSLKHCVCGGEPLNPQVMEQWKAQTGLDIYEGYGQTETVLLCGTFKGMKIKPGSMGKASAAYNVQIIDDNGNILPPGTEGEIAICIKPTRPFCLFTHYTNDPEKTASTLKGNFYSTGDRGIMDEDGYVWFVSRSDDIILSSGYRIGPFEVESALMEHPAVIESGAVSSPDPIRGEVVKAFVVLSEAYKSHDPEKLTRELQEHVKKITAPYKYPRKVEFVQQLPKTISGKIQRNELRKREWEKA